MRIGDKVRWASQAGGYAKVKVGVIFRVIPADTIVTIMCPEIKAGGSAWGGGCRRNHESYVVKVENKLYWPLVKNLQFIESNPQETPEEKQTRWPAWMTS